MLNFIKAVLAGIAIGLAGLVYAILAPFGIGYKIAGAFIFSFGLICVCEEGLNLITGKFYQIYSGEWKPGTIIAVLFGNFLGTAIIFLIRRFDVLPELVYEVMQPIITSRDSQLWYQHILAGIICGICIQAAVINFAAYKNSWGIIFPIMIFILVGGQHCIADCFYMLWSPINTWGFHFIEILEVFIGNAIGAGIMLLPKLFQHTKI